MTDPNIRHRRQLAFFCAPPDNVSAALSTFQCAALTIIGREIMATDSCRLTISEIAERAFVSPSSVRGAVKVAKAHGLIEVADDGAITTRCDEWLSRMMDCEDAVAELEADNADRRED